MESVGNISRGDTVMTNNDCGDNYAGFFLLKWFRVLLVVFIFVVGMVGNGNVEAASKSMERLTTEFVEWGAKHLREELLFDVPEQAKTINDLCIVEGSKNLKIKYVKDEDGDDSFDSILGEVAPGQKIRVHIIYKVPPLATVNERRSAKGWNPVEYYNWSFALRLIAKSGNKTVKEIQKTYKNTRDNIIEYQVAKGVTQIEIKVHSHNTGKVKNHKDLWDEEDDFPVLLTVNNNLKPVPISSVKKTDKDNTTNEKSASDNKDDNKQEQKSDLTPPAGNVAISEKTGVFPGTGPDESEDLPESDAGKAAAAVGTALGGGLLGLAGGAAGGGGGGSEAGGGTEGGAEAEPESFVFTDPATGAQSLYERDPETGQWVNPQTGGFVDISDLDRFAKQREADAKWTSDQMDNLRNRTTETDRLLRDDQEKLRQKFEEIDRQGAKDKAAIRSGTYGMTDEQRNDYLNKRQSQLINKQEAAHQTAKNWDRAVKTAQVVQKAADIAVDGLSVATGPAGKLVANIYTGVKNVAGETTDAVVNGKSVVGGIAKGLAKGGADIGQNLAGGKWYTKLATYVGTETGKELVVAVVDGESKTAALQKGLVNAGMKWSIDAIGDTISGGFGQQNANEMKQHYKEINWVWNKDLSQKSVNTLTHMNYQKYFAKENARELAQGFGQSITKEMGSTTYDVGVAGKSVTESMFDEKW